MSESLTIDRDNKLPKSLDYDFLRKEGIRLIESLSGNIWTDYNTHDPGITLLEAMCYTLTDLGYRTSFNIEDILTAPHTAAAERWKKLFYTAREVLPCNPLTLIDYRKLIIDTEGVRNAWIEKSDDYEILMYLQKTQKNQPTNQPYTLTYDYKKGEEVLHLRGLYKVFVEYEDEVIDEKREAEVAKVVWQKLQFHRNLTEDFLSVSSIEYEHFPIEAVIQVSEGIDIEMINAKIYKVIYDFFSPPVTFYSLEQMLEKNLSPEEIFDGPILNYGFIDTAELQRSERFKNIHLSDIISLISGIEGVIAIKKFTFQLGSQTSYSNFTEWINNVKDKEKTPKLDIDKSIITFQRSGDRHRAIIEQQVDKVRVKAMFNFLQSDNFRSRLRGSGKDLPVPAGQFMDIANYYPFQKTLPASYGMMESFVSSDEIDRAVVEKAANELLVEKAGIKGAKLVNSMLNYKKEKSGIEKAIAALIADPAGNASFLREIIDKAFDDEGNEKMLKNIIRDLLGSEPETMHRHHLYKHVEENPEYSAPSKKTIKLQRLALIHLNKSLNEINSSGDIARLNTLYKMDQVDALERRKKLVLQLRGFLMVFEQILADYLSKLGQIREIFSFSDNVTQTSYPQVINEIRDMEALFIDFTHYKENHLKIVEPSEVFHNKRNDILDHILSRYSESMDKYAFFMQQFDGKEAAKRLISDKVDFLADYVQISSYRNKGYNYTDQDNNWDSSNVEGVKKRICRLLGIKNYNRKKIAHNAFFVQKKMLEEDVERYVVTMVEPGDQASVLLTSIDYKFESEARIILTYILEQGNDKTLYTKGGNGNKWFFELKRLTPENKQEPVAVSRHYATADQRDDAFEKMLQTLSDIAADENFHILDHILLRPKLGPGEMGASFPDITLLPAEYVPDKINVAETQKKDVPYKFKITHTRDEDRKNRNHWKLSLMKDNMEFLIVKDDFIFYKHLTRRMDHIRKFAADIANYKTVELQYEGYVTYQITDGDTVLAESKKNYRKEQDFEEEIKNLVSFLSFEQGFLIPTDENTPSFYADPYSFQLSFILPSWQPRFRNTTFKHLIEKTIYLETPAHIYPHVYWLDHHEMKQFDEAYELWVKEVATNEIPATDIVNDLIKVLIKLRK